MPDLFLFFLRTMNICIRYNSSKVAPYVRAMRDAFSVIARKTMYGHFIPLSVE